MDFVVPHDPNWKAAFDTEARLVATALGDTEIELHHIGSTAIKGILAKPIIDLLGVVGDLKWIDQQTKQMESLGYEVMGQFGIDGRRYFRKSNAKDQRTHHLHVFQSGSVHIERHLAFRDYLRHHTPVAAEYSALKQSLTSGTGASWDKYLDGKDPFIKATEKDALKWYQKTRAE
jgi:GrpB-like predicted nucleotidyltransferase (UPF0157 family)